MDHEVFGEPSGEEPVNFIPRGSQKAAGLVAAVEQFNPKQMHSWLTKKGGLPMDENPHTAENSGIPFNKMKNASLKEMLSRIDHWQREQERFNQRVILEIRMLKEEKLMMRQQLEQTSLQTKILGQVLLGIVNSKTILNIEDDKRLRDLVQTLEQSKSYDQ